MFAVALLTGPAVAVSLAVTVGAVEFSREPKLEMLTGLVCRASLVAFSGICMLFATFARGSLICVVGGPSLIALCATSFPSSAFIALVAGFGLIWCAWSFGLCSLMRRSSAKAAAPVRRGFGDSPGDRPLRGDFGESEERKVGPMFGLREAAATAPAALSVADDGTVVGEFRVELGVANGAV